jgi:peptide/nickel transport system substrate-binding protein
MDDGARHRYGADMIRRGGSILLVALLVVACTGGGTTSSSAPPNPGSGGTLELGMTGTPFSDLDPQNEWFFATWELFRCCLLRTLMSYDGTSGVTGAEPKPDLAAAPPDVSTDGLTWTFHLRPDLHYGPPLQDVQITSPDFERALLRAGDPTTSSASLSSAYLANIDGFTRYMDGKADSISGVETPDPLTLRIHELRPDTTLLYDLALATTAPIPPSPSDPSARYGVATGHDRSSDPSRSGGYGLFLVSSGPYMIEGEDEVDFTKPPDQQIAPSGFHPWKITSDYETVGFGSLTLVRNPSWNPGVDPLRAALPDRIVIHGGSSASLFRQVGTGRLAMVFDETPPPAMLRHDLKDPSLRPFVQSVDTGNLVMADFILTQPPFDDLSVRLAVADALDRRGMLGPIRDGYGFGGTVLANHYASDSSEEGLAAGWDPFVGAGGAADIAAARHEMARSRYASGGRCADPVCRVVTVFVQPNMGSVAPTIAHSLSSIGIEAKVEVRDDFYDVCNDPPPSAHVGMCVGDGWFPDYPSVGNLIVTNFGGPTVTAPYGITQMGATPGELAKLGSPVRSVPSVAREIVACDQEIGPAGIACWTRLDQYLVTQVMPAVPLAFGQTIRLTSPSVVAFSWDLSLQTPALDRLAVAPSS